jgi:hypothetical protein
MGDLRKRLGRFVVNRAILDSASIEELNLLFEDVVIFRAELMYQLDGVEYLAFSPRFDVSSEGALPPYYSVEVTSELIELGGGECSHHAVDFKFIKET